MSDDSLQQLFVQAVGHHRAGRHALAESTYRAIVDRDANFAEAWHHLGLLAIEKGRLGDAETLIGRGLALAPTASMHSNLGEVLRRQRKFEAAIAAGRRALALRADIPELHANLGHALKAAGSLDEAIKAFERAAELRDGSAEFHFHHAVALRARGDLPKAIAAFKRALQRNPNLAEAHFNLAEALGQLGQKHEAIDALRRALELKPDFPQALNNLANLLSELGRLDEAIPAYQQAAALAGADGAALLNLGRALVQKERYAQAVAELQHAVQLRPDDPQAHASLGEAYVRTYEPRKAHASFLRALELKPASADLLKIVGLGLNQIGRFQEARQCFRRAVDLSADAGAFLGLLGTGPHQPAPADFERFAAALERGDWALEDQIGAQFVLGKLLDERGSYQEAFEHFAAGNRLFKESRAAAGFHFDLEELRRRVEAVIHQATAQSGGVGCDSELPVFIVGMPRSGTSLVEQIVASHGQVFGAGELQLIPRIAERAAAEQTQLAEAYVEHLRGLGKSARRVTDKMPQNVFHLPLIARLFPKARVILCRRDPRDNALSCYFERFHGDNLLFSYDLADCGRQYLETARVMEFCLKNLPLRMLQVQYEKLVEDQESQTRRLIEFLDLPWDPDCLHFDRNQRPVLTASEWQVRQPVYKSSVGRWKNYEPQLGPLLQVLETARGQA